ncbi:type II secretion system F family protein [Candidatus Parcubacteria bacterium]|nr:type II secretion system F family protein [Candidatus Parcubacteria bacterium]
MEYNFQAKTQTGEITSGKVEAPNEDAIVSTLHSRGLIILSLTPIKKDILSSDLNQIFAQPNTKDIVVFTRQLSTLIEADVPLAQGLRTLAKQVDKPTFKKIITGVAESVESGSSLSLALGEYPKLFGSFYVKLVQAGEVTGKLQGSLLYLADYLERSQSTNSKIKGALAYPAFVVFALVIVAGIMTIYVLPQLLTIFKDAGVQDLPITTRILIAVTDFVNAYLYYLIFLLITAGVVIYRFMATPQGKAWLDNVIIKFPTLGKVIRNLFLARVAESLSTLIKSGISILDAIKITGELVGNHNYQKILIEAEEKVRGGGFMSDVFSEHEEMPPLFTSMVAIGEKTGKLDYMLENISKFYKSESETAIGSITQLIEPILVLVLGIAVAILVSSILLPIYSLVGTS